MKNSIKKTSLCLLIGLCIISLLPIHISAEVFTEKSGVGRSNAVYIAGNPNMYPVEWYDSESNTYKGIIPDIISEISENTVIDFVYIYSGKENRQKELYENNQVEMLTTVSDDNDCGFPQGIPVLTYEYNNKIQTYSVVFTKSMSENTANAIISALSQISETKKTGYVISNSANSYSAPQYLLPFIIIFLLLTASIVLLIILLFARKNKARNNPDYTDPLTGLGNGDYYIYSFDSLISEQAKNLYSLAYIAFDFEKAENQFGKNSVSDIEKYIATQLISYAGSAEYISRIQTGVFTFLFQSENSEKAYARIAQAVDGTNRYLSEFGYENIVAAGICRLCEHKDYNSETAFYNAKQGYLYSVSNGLKCHISSETQLAQTQKTKNLRKAIDKAIKNGDFKIHMQLITDSSTGNFCGAEVFSRWQNSEYGLLRPYEYIELLKETKNIFLHDYAVFEQVCATLERWHTTPHKDMFLTCNFTRLSLERDDFADEINRISGKYNFSREKLIIEITEDSLNSNIGVLSKNIADLKRFGFKIAIDDMGTGFSSLSDMYDNEVDIVKIEKEFISSCVTERRKKMLGDIISLVHNAQAKIICEGIETKSQSEMLKSLGCDMMQGYYYARALPVTECERILNESISSN